MSTSLSAHRTGGAHDLDAVFTIDNFFDNEMIEWCVWYFHQFDHKRFNAIKYIQDSHWNLPFNRWFGSYLRERVKDIMPECIIHSAYIGNDTRPGGIHTDGWLYEAERDVSYRSILVPLRFNVPSSTVIFNETADQALTLNAVTGLGSDGIDTMTQTQVLDPTQSFDPVVHDKYLKHLDISGLAGLTLHSVHKWTPGQAISWHRSRWHGPAYFDGNTVERYHVVIMTHLV